jgi:streptogramin lyase
VVLGATVLVAAVTPAVVASAPAASADGTAGVFTNYPGTGIASPAGITTGPDGALWFVNQGNESIGRISTTGEVSNFPVGPPPGNVGN